MKITIEDIAKISNTSKSTVSRYLNNGSVSQKTAKNIKKAIKKTGFQINVSASRLKKNKSNLIGVLYEGFESISVSNMLSGINDELKTLNYQPFIMLDKVEEKERLKNVKALVKQGVDGIIFGTSTMTNKQLKYLSQLEVPVIIIGQKSNTIPYRKVNDYKASYDLGKYLGKNKYTKILFLTRPKADKAIGQERVQGFIDGIDIKQNNIKFKILTTKFSIKDAYDKTSEIFPKFHPDLIIGATDKMAMGAIWYLNMHNIKIPKETAVAGFGNYDYDEVLSPSLTSVSFDYFKLGKDAAKSIVALIDKKKIKQANEDFYIKIIPRESTL